MQRILVGRWMFFLALLAFVVSWVLATINGWMYGFNTINGYDPTPALFVVPLGILLFSYAVGGPLARREWISGLLVERWLFLIGTGSYVGGYAAALIIGEQFNARTGEGTNAFPISLILSVILYGLSASFGHEPTPPPAPAPIPGPGGVPREPPNVAPLARPVPSPPLTGTLPRRFDRLFTAIAIVVLALIFVFWTGYDPALYGPTALQWTLEYRICGPGGNSTFLPIYEHRFPLWAQVHVVWSADAEGLVYTYGPMGPYYDGLGMSGNWSFVSNAQPVVFVASPTPTPSCGDFTVDFEATVTL